MANGDVKKLMNIPKKHTLKHYMELLGQLYGEKKETLDVYIEEQLIKNEDKLDEAIDCFKSMVPPPKPVEHKVEVNYQPMKPREKAARRRKI